MNVMESHDYRNAGEQAKEVLRLRGSSLDRDSRTYLEVLKRRAETLGHIERITGLKFDVFNKADPHIAAFITKAGKETHVAEHTLDDPVWATYAARHEAMHKRTSGFMNMGRYSYIPRDHYDALKNRLDGMDIKIGGTDVVEGFTDLLTAREHGKNNKSGYSDHEVPAAEKLDELCIEMTGVSLADAFMQNDVALFHERLERLCEVLMMREAMDDLQREAPDKAKVEDLKPKIIAKMKTEQPIVHDKKDAERITRKLMSEVVALENVRAFLARPANDAADKIAA